MRSWFSRILAEAGSPGVEMSTFPPLQEVRSGLKVKWYRSKVEPAVLRSLTARSNTRGLLQALGHFALYLVTGAATYWMWSLQIWWAFALGLFVHGTVASFLRGISTHELAHGTVFRSKGMNKLFLYLFSILNWWNHFDYAMSHTYHHRFTLHPAGDREVLLPLNPVPGFFSMVQLFTVNLFIRPGRTFSSGGFFPTVLKYLRAALGLPGRSNTPSGEWIQALHRDQPIEARKSAWWCRATLLLHAAIIVLSVATGLWVLPLLVTVAPFTASAALYAVGIAQHCGLRNSTPDFRKCARSIRLGPVLTFLYWQMNWHAEHHMYAAVPCYRLRKLALVVAADVPEPKSLSVAWSEMLDTWRRQKLDPSYQLDLPLPETANPEFLPDSPQSEPAVWNADGSGGLEESIGNLAPDGLA